MREREPVQMFTAEETVKSILLIKSKIPHQKGLYLYNMQRSFVLRPLILTQEAKTQTQSS